MTDAGTDLDPLDRLAEEFVTRLRAGEKPTVDEYAARHPELAADIRETFPVLVAMERVKPASDPRPNVPGYRILGLVGQGGMGDVYEAVQETLGRRVALKLLRPRGRLTDGLRERFRREAQAAGRLHHTHIVPVFDSGEADGQLYFAMQLIPGRGLDAVLGEVRAVRADDTTGRTPAAETASTLTGTGREYHRTAARLLADAADALAYAHRRGVLHRDVKPSNLLLDDGGAVWVTDFGLAKADDAGDLTDTGDVVGTVRYMAPERFDGRADARSDVYALGLTAYEFATLRPAYDGPADPALVRRILAGPPPSPRTVDPTVPRDLETVILKATAANPAHRYQTADGLAADLRRFADGLPVTARRVSAVEAAWRAARRNPLVAGLVAAVVLVSVTGAGLAGLSAWRAGRNADLAAASESRANEATARAESRAETAREALEALSDDALDRMFPSQMTALSSEQIGFLRTLLDLNERLADAGGSTPAARFLLARGRYRAGRIYSRLRETAAAEDAFRGAADAFAALAAECPDDPSHRRWEGVARRQLGAELFPRRRADAVAESGRSVELLEGVVSAAAEDRLARHELAVASRMHGEWLKTDRRYADAEACLRRAIALEDGLAADGGRNPLWVATGVEARFSLANMLAAQKGRSAAAAAEWKQLVATLGSASAGAEAGRFFREQRAHALSGYASCLAAGGDPSGADAQFAEAVAAFRGLLADDPLRLDYPEFLAQVLTARGDALKSSRPDAADPAFREAAKILSELASRQPDVVLHRLRLAGVYASRAGLVGRTDAAGALALYESAEALLTGCQPRESALGQLLWVYQRKAFTLEGLDRPADAETAWTRVLELGGDAHRRVALVRRALVRMKLGQASDAAADADAAVAVPGTAGRGPEFYMCAGVLADAAAATSNADLRDRRGASAVAALRRAADDGFFHSPANPVPPPGTTPRFAGLRDRADFKLLVVELDARPKPTATAPPQPAALGR